jgi:hypothetical protein
MKNRMEKKENIMQSKKKQIIFFLVCILFILGGLFTGIYWITHINQLKQSGMGTEVHKITFLSSAPHVGAFFVGM